MLFLRVTTGWDTESVALGRVHQYPMNNAHPIFVWFSSFDPAGFTSPNLNVMFNSESLICVMQSHIINAWSSMAGFRVLLSSAKWWRISLAEICNRCTFVSLEALISHNEFSHCESRLTSSATFREYILNNAVQSTHRQMNPKQNELWPTWQQLKSLNQDLNRSRNSWEKKWKEWRLLRAADVFSYYFHNFRLSNESNARIIR